MIAADLARMAVRLAAWLPRLLIFGLIWVLASGTLTFAAARRIEHRAEARAAAVPAQMPTLIVPDVRRQAFVFAKSILEDTGLAWRVTGAVHGYSTNVVVTQSPAPGTRILDTGAPTLLVMLAHGRYPEQGTPQDTPSYRGTPIKLWTAAAVQPLPHVVPAKPRAAKRKARAAPRASVKPLRHLRVRHRGARRPRVAQRRPAFAAAGAPREPLREISLPARANELSAWLTPNRRPTGANVKYWLYQQAWIIQGAEFGWWHGAQALRALIAVDRRVQAQWGIGGRSEAAARGALAVVEAKTR